MEQTQLEQHENNLRNISDLQKHGAAGDRSLSFKILLEIRMGLCIYFSSKSLSCIEDGYCFASKVLKIERYAKMPLQKCEETTGISTRSNSNGMSSYIF